MEQIASPLSHPMSIYPTVFLWNGHYYAQAGAPMPNLCTSFPFNLNQTLLSAHHKLALIEKLLPEHENC